MVSIQETGTWDKYRKLEQQTGQYMEKNREYKGVVTGLGTEGEGIIKCDGITVFVPLCLVGETVTFKVLKVQGSIAYGKAVRIENPSPDRKEPACPVFAQCGGCSLQHMSYEAQLKFKRDMVRSSLKKIGGIDTYVADTVPCDSEYRYRNKLALPIGTNSSGETVCGFYAPRSHRIVEIADCCIQAEWVKDIISCVLQYAKESHLAPFNGKSGTLRHIVVRRVGERYIIALVSARKVNVTPLISMLERHFKDFTFLLNINPKDTNVIFGDEWHTCRGEGFLDTEEAGISFTVGANTFMQVNDEIRSKLYAHVLKQAEGAKAAVDLYSGGGLLTAMLAKKCGMAYGIEIVPEATQCANTLKDKNGLQGKMVNICGAAEDNIQIMEKAADGGVIVCDPPRKGMERSVVKALMESNADRIVLISCNPATLARDLGLLAGTLKEEGRELVKTGNGSSSGNAGKACSNGDSNGGAEPSTSRYVIQSVTPFDMFPQTKWCETVAVLTRTR